MKQSDQKSEVQAFFKSLRDAIKQYDDNKGLWRRMTSDTIAIQKLKELMRAETVRPELIMLLVKDSKFRGADLSEGSETAKVLDQCDKLCLPWLDEHQKRLYDNNVFTVSCVVALDQVIVVDYKVNFVNRILQLNQGGLLNDFNIKSLLKTAWFLTAEADDLFEFIERGGFEQKNFLLILNLVNYNQNPTEDVRNFLAQLGESMAQLPAAAMADAMSPSLPETSEEIRRQDSEDRDFLQEQLAPYQGDITALVSGVVVANIPEQLSTLLAQEAPLDPVAVLSIFNQYAVARCFQGLQKTCESRFFSRLSYYQKILYAADVLFPDYDRAVEQVRLWLGLAIAMVVAKDRQIPLNLIRKFLPFLMHHLNPVNGACALKFIYDSEESCEFFRNNEDVVCHHMLIAEDSLFAIRAFYTYLKFENPMPSVFYFDRAKVAELLGYMQLITAHQDPRGFTEALILFHHNHIQNSVYYLYILHRLHKGNMDMIAYRAQILIDINRFGLLTQDVVDTILALPGENIKYLAGILMCSDYDNASIAQQQLSIYLDQSAEELKKTHQMTVKNFQQQTVFERLLSQGTDDIKQLIVQHSQQSVVSEEQVISLLSRLFRSESWSGPDLDVKGHLVVGMIYLAQVNNSAFSFVYRYGREAKKLSYFVEWIGSDSQAYAWLATNEGQVFLKNIISLHSVTAKDWDMAACRLSRGGCSDDEIYKEILLILLRKLHEELIPVNRRYLFDLQPNAALQDGSVTLQKFSPSQSVVTDTMPAAATLHGSFWLSAEKVPAVHMGKSESASDARVGSDGQCEGDDEDDENHQKAAAALNSK